jgi:hypothetical protein
MTDTEFTIEAVFGDATIKMAVQSDMVEAIVTHWNEQLAQIGVEELRAETRQLVVSSLMHETHHKPREAHDVASALVWLTVTGPYGEKLLPFMKVGDVELRYEITRLGPTNFNFRLSVDEKTKAALG